MSKIKQKKVSTKESFDYPTSLNEALTSINVAITLGAEILAPVGSYIYLLTVSPNFFLSKKISFIVDNNTVSLYHSEAKAKDGLLKIILER